MIVTNKTNGLKELGNHWCWTDSTKKPKGLDGTCLKVNDPLDWMTFDDALVKTSETPGRTLGLLMNPEDDLVCIDLDDCLDITSSRNFSTKLMNYWIIGLFFSNLLDSCCRSCKFT